MVTDVKRLTKAALLTSVALMIFVIELQIPPVTPIPGVKLGLANIITIYAIFLLGPLDAAMILFSRILLGSFFSGQMMSLMYSLAGGTACYLVMVMTRRLVSPEQIWVCSVIGAIAHNLGQITVAIWVAGTWAMIYYLPALMVSGVIAGIFTGVCAQAVIKRSKTI